MAKGEPCKFRPSKLCVWDHCPFRKARLGDGPGCWREKAEKALEEAIDGDRKAVKRLRECVEEISRTTIPPT